MLKKGSGITTCLHGIVQTDIMKEKFSGDSLKETKSKSTFTVSCLCQ